MTVSWGEERNETVSFRIVSAKVQQTITKRNSSVPKCTKGQAATRRPESADGRLTTKRAVPPGHPLRNYVRGSSCRCRSWRRARRLRLLTACSGVPTVGGAWQEYAQSVSPGEGAWTIG